MATKVGKSVSQSVLKFRCCSSASNRHLSSSSSASMTHPAFLAPEPLFLLRPFIPNPSLMNQVRCRVNQSGNYSPLNNSSSGPPTEMAPLIPGCDYEHWVIVMDKPAGDKQQIIHSYIQTLAQVLGSEEEAKKKIYNVSCERYFGFGCEIDEETSNKLKGLPGVLFVHPDSYVDAENKDYGAELFLNGEIVQRSPERQRRVEPPPQQDRLRPNSIRYMRQRENR